MVDPPPSPDPTIYLSDSEESTEDEPLDDNGTIFLDEDEEEENEEEETMEVHEQGNEAAEGEEPEEEPSEMEVDALTGEMSGLTTGDDYQDSSIEIIEGSEEMIERRAPDDDIINLGDSDDEKPLHSGEEDGEGGDDSNHDSCGATCLKGGEQRFDRGVLSDSTTSPFLVPILCGWKREKKALRSRSGLQRGMVVYNTPCERALHHLGDVNDFLNFAYISHRFPHDNRVKMLSNEFCSGCTCTDYCSDATNCACQQLTFAESRSKTTGYSGKRLVEQVPSGIYECNQFCRCSKKRCLNRVVQQGITIPLQVYKTIGSGWGVRSLVDLPQGSFVCSLNGPVITDEMADELADDQEYFAQLDHCSLCDVGKYFEEEGATKLFVLNVKTIGNIGRLINHSCDPNLFTQQVFLETHDPRLPHVAFFTKKDVKAGEELVFDYGWVVDIANPRGVICRCGSTNCRRVLL